MLNSKLVAVFAAGTITITGLAGLAGAKGGVNPAAGGVRSALSLVGGEDPSIPATATPATADARFTGKVSKVTLAGMQSTRFPLTVRNQANATVTPCSATFALGSLTGSGPLATDPNVAGATTATFSWTAPSSAGAKASIDVVCDWTDRKGVVQHHETHWAGTL